MMELSGISNVLRVLNRPNLDDAAEKMRRHPEAAASGFAELLECINNAGHEHGIGITGQNALTARTHLQQFAGAGDVAERTSAASRAELVELLQYMRPLGESFRAQLNMPGSGPQRVELLQKMVRMTEDLQRFSGPGKPSGPA